MSKKKIDPLDFEEEFLKQDRKEEKRERKKTQNADRSKFKESNLNKKVAEKPPSAPMTRGRVLSIHREIVVVEAKEREFFCTLRGILKKDKTLMKNLLAVGDFVLFSEEDLSIYFVEERHSILSREERRTKQQHIIAVNIDQVLITVSVVSPPLKPALVDRYIIAAIKGRMQPVVVVNKIELLKGNPRQKELFEEFISSHEKSGVKVICVSAKKKKGIKELAAVMKEKTSVFSGQSGVGKSSLINLITHQKLKTGDIVKRSQKGSHVTTRAQLLVLPFGGFCIDTPGINSFGVWDLKEEEIQNYFAEIKHFSHFCKYPNCQHENEPECAVREAVEENKISYLRFASFHSLILDTQGLKERKSYD